MRRFFLVLPVLLLLLAAAAWVAAPRYDLANFAADRASAALGRAVAIESLRITPGRWVQVELRGATLANIPGGSQPEMARLGHLSAEVDALSLLHGPLVLRAVAIEDATLLLEKTREHIRNWRFGAPDAAPQPADRALLPLLTAAILRRGEVVIRTTGGQRLSAAVTELNLAAAEVGQPVTLRASGAWNGIPVTMTGTLDPVAVLRDAGKPYGIALRAESGRTRLAFTGTSTDPLNADGLAGLVHLQAPSMAEALKFAGLSEADLDAPLDVTGRLDHQGERWRLTGATGHFAGSALKAPLLELVEGATGQPDAVTADVDLAQLNLNRVLKGGAEADMPLLVAANPDPRITAKLRIGELTFSKLAATHVSLHGTILPNRITVEELRLTTHSAQLTATGHLEPLGRGARIAADIDLIEGDLETLRRGFGLRPLPVTGTLVGRVAVVAEGTHLAQATAGADIAAVVALSTGRIAREVVKQASVDLGLLFNHAEGRTPLTCALGVVRMRAGIGEVAPLRLRSAEGTISGVASFDLNRQVLDMIIGTDPSTTGSLALDIPIRAAGRFDAPNILPASWSAEGRAKLASAYSDAALPPALLDYARRNACYTLTGPAIAPPRRKRR